MLLVALNLYKSDNNKIYMTYDDKQSLVQF